MALKSISMLISQKERLKMTDLRVLIGIILLSFSFALFADNEADSIAAYSIIWKTAGCNVEIDSQASQ